MTGSILIISKKNRRSRVERNYWDELIRARKESKGIWW